MIKINNMSRFVRSVCLIILFIAISCSNSNSQSIQFEKYILNNNGKYISSDIDSARLYALTDFGIIIWDISNKFAPVIVKEYSYPLGSATGKIKKYNNYLYILRGLHMTILDISNLNSIHTINFILNPYYIYDFDIIENYLVVKRNVSCIEVYDIADVNNITLHTTLPNGEIRVYKQNVFILDGNSLCRFKLINNNFSASDSLLFSFYDREINSFIANDSIIFLSFKPIITKDFCTNSFIYKLQGNSYSLIDSTLLPLECDFKAINDSVVLYNYACYLYLVNFRSTPEIVDSTIYYGHSFSSVNINKCHFYIMELCRGFTIDSITPIDNIETCAERFCGGCFSRLDFSYDRLFAINSDSLFFTDRFTDTIMHSVTYNANDIFFKDSLIFEYFHPVDNTPHYINLSTINNNQRIVRNEIPGDNNGFEYFYINQNHIFHDYHGIYEINSPDDIVSISSSSPRICHFYNNMYYEYETYPSYMANIYAFTPAFTLVSSKSISNLPNLQFGFYILFSDSSGHCFDYTTQSVFKLRLSDTSNIHFSDRYFINGIFCSDYENRRIFNSILYLPRGNVLQIIDMYDSQHHRKILDFAGENGIVDYVVVDSTLYISYGGYIAKYNMSNVLPGLVETSDIKFNVMNEDILKTYPNPSHGFVNVKVPKDFIHSTYSIFSLQGQTLKNKILIQNEIFGIELPSGVYMIEVLNKGDVYIKKIVVI